jgi:hypothetical protein
MFHGEYRNTSHRDIPEGVGFAHFLTDDPKLTVAARTTYVPLLYHCCPVLSLCGGRLCPSRLRYLCLCARACRLRYSMKLDIATHRFAEEVRWVQEVVRPGAIADGRVVEGKVEGM